MLKRIDKFPRLPDLNRAIVTLIIACLLSLTLLVNCAPCSPYSPSSQNEIYLSVLPQADLIPYYEVGFEQFPHPQEKFPTEEFPSSPTPSKSRFPDSQEELPANGSPPSPISSEPTTTIYASASLLSYGFCTYSTSARSFNEFDKSWGMFLVSVLINTFCFMNR